MHWLRDRGSLTARIQARGRFTVRVLRQRLCPPTRDEAQLLGMEAKAFAWVREVVLLCADQRVVFAHTVLPRRPRGPLQVWLSRLGERSLGALLFSHAGFRRGQMNFKRLDYRHPLFSPASNALRLPDGTVNTLWARRSHFRFGIQSVLVTEVFSPLVLKLRTADQLSSDRKSAAPSEAML
ncbi:MAG: chorismate lyase [Candidatus Accumulibacter sp.]|nr:chorismate lyase [Accumulibacter sp.]